MSELKKVEEIHSAYKAFKRAADIFSKFDEDSAFKLASVLSLISKLSTELFEGCKKDGAVKQLKDGSYLCFGSMLHMKAFPFRDKVDVEEAKYLFCSTMRLAICTEPVMLEVGVTMAYTSFGLTLHSFAMYVSTSSDVDLRLQAL